MDDRMMEYTAKEIPVVFDGDVVVVGGGVSGFTAAICAARHGARVALIERDGVLGGTATTTLMSWFHRPYNYTDGIVREIFDRLIVRGSTCIETGLASDPEAFKNMALEMVLTTDAQLFLHNQFFDVNVDGKNISAVFTLAKDGIQAFRGKVFIDATGDADVSYRAGAPCQKGRESDGKMRPVSLLFCLSGIDYPRFARYIKDNPEEFSTQRDRVVLDLERSVIRIFGLFKTVETAVTRGELDPSVHYVRFEGGNTHTGIAYLNTTRLYGLDGTTCRDLAKAEIAGRRQIDQIIDMLRKVPGLENVSLVFTAPRLGVRETRRIIGEHCLSEDEIIQGAKLTDTVLIGHQYALPGAPLHEPDGTEGAKGDTRERGTEQEFVVPYPIPWRAFLPARVEHLLVAGRCVSVKHTGDRYVRSMPDCMMEGQVAGTAAAMASQSGIAPRDLPVEALRRALMRDGVRYDW